MNLYKNRLARYFSLILFATGSFTYGGKSIRITVGTCNVLQQNAYNTWFDVKFVNGVKTEGPDAGKGNQYQPLKKRQDIFDSAPFLYQQNIIGLQESYNDSPKLQLSDNDYNIQQNKGLYLASKKKLFKEIENGYKPFEQANSHGFLYQILELVGAPGETVGVINTHIKGGNPPQGFTYESFRESQLGDILTTFIQNDQKNSSGRWIVMGDFNWRYADGNIKPWIDLKGFDIGSTETTNYDQNSKEVSKLVKLDYILSKNIKRNKDSVFPGIGEQETKLLTHSTADKNRDYFSDHAMLTTSFTIDIPAAIQSQQIPQPQPQPIIPIASKAPSQSQQKPAPQQPQPKPVQPMPQPKIQQPAQVQAQPVYEVISQPKPLQPQQPYTRAPKQRRRRQKKQEQPVYLSEQQQYPLPAQTQPITTQPITTQGQQQQVPEAYYSSILNYSQKTFNNWLQKIKAAVDSGNLDAVKKYIPKWEN